MGQFEKILPDIGVLISTDPVAIDKASLDLVENMANQKLSHLAFDIPYQVQLDYAAELGLGNLNYQLVETNL